LNKRRIKSLKNSVRSLQTLYTITVSLGLERAIVNLIDISKGNIPIKFELIPYFIAFLITLIPFYHGALRHLNIVYIEEKGKDVRSGALLIDFSLLFLESCLIFGLSILLPNHYWFFITLLLLLLTDVLWTLIFLALSKKEKKLSLAELRWLIINSIVIILCLINIGVLVISKFPRSIFELEISIFTLFIFLIRTVFDYLLCWSFYFPPIQN